MRVLVLLSGMVLFLFTGVFVSYAADEDAKINSFGIAYFIENKQVEELLFSTARVYGLLNDVNIVYKSSAEREILVIAANNAVEDGRLSGRILDLLSDSDRRVISNLFFDFHDCSIRNFESKKQGMAGQSAEPKITKQTLVVMNVKGHTQNEQLKCIYLGLIQSIFGGTEITEWQRSASVPELVERILIEGYIERE